MLLNLSLHLTILIFIALSITLVLAACSSKYIMAASRNDHNNHDKNSHDSNHNKKSSRNDHNNHDKNSHGSNHNKKSSRNDHNNQDTQDNTGDRADLATTGNQNISCMGSFMNCRNDITNIICAHVTYCFIGPTTPFMMANPTSQ